MSQGEGVYSKKKKGVYKEEEKSFSHSDFWVNLHQRKNDVVIMEERGVVIVTVGGKK